MRGPALLAALLASFAVGGCNGYDCAGRPISFSQAVANARGNATVNGAAGGQCFTLDPPGSTPQALPGDGGVSADEECPDGGDAGDVDECDGGGP